MKNGILSKVDEQIKKFQADHAGEKPLYILVSPFESEALYEAVKRKEGHSQDIVLTTYKGTKIVENGSLKQGDLRVTNELPESGS